MTERFHGRPAQSRSSGIASYYSDALAGRSTASGEPYEPRAYTAAHRSLPFGSIVRVVREDTGELTYVKINDRGPFVRGRVIDLSRAAAEEIDLIRRGIVRVRVEVVERGIERPKNKSRRARGKRRN